MKKRAGKGFTLEELKEAKVNRKEARTIGISVDFRRKNRSEQSLRENVARLSEYKANLIVFPKECNRKKPQATDSSKDACSKAEQVIGDVHAHRQAQAHDRSLQDHAGGQGQEGVLHAAGVPIRCQARWQARRRREEEGFCVKCFLSCWGAFWSKLHQIKGLGG